MAGILDQVQETPVDDILQRLESGEDVEAVRRALDLEASAIVVALASGGLGVGLDDGPPLIQGKPTRPKLLPAASERSLAKLFPSASEPRRLALAAGLLQAFDAWDPSHEAAQEADDRGERLTSQFWHGIAHRREPDAWNAGYWFRRVGRHQDFPSIASAARPLLEEHADAGLTDRLVGRGWDPESFIQLTTRESADSNAGILGRRIQRLEFSILLGTSLGQVAQR